TGPSSPVNPEMDRPAPAAPALPVPDVGAPVAAPSRESDEPARPDTIAPSAANAPLQGEITPELDRSVERGLAALAASQNADGTFGSGRFARNVAVTSLSALAFMSDGHLPGRGKYGTNVQKALDSVLANATETGLIASEIGSGPMYGHGFATLFLGEIYGMTGGGAGTPQSQKLHDALVRACRLIERTQNEEGGWRYNPVPYDADVSVTICMIMALRSARNAGIEVPRSTIDRAVEYVRKAQNPDGGFMYQLSSGVSAWPRSAAGVASLFYAGIYQDQAITSGMDYLRRNAMPNSPSRTESHYWYGQYYTAQSFYLAGGEQWAAFWPAVRAELIDRQGSSGMWVDQSIGNAYATAMALIVLQIPKRYLPIFQK
ncbi:MAG: prenyltransferase/squalene oxidase repeat-containing protein, partial [Planctomyces sp.]